jgi:hypothetical protein
MVSICQFLTGNPPLAPYLPLIAFDSLAPLRAVTQAASYRFDVDL